MDDLELTLKNQQKYFFFAPYMKILNRSQVKVSQQKSILMFPEKLKAVSLTTDQWVLKKSGYFENKGRNGIRILENNMFQKIYFSISFVFP